MRIPSFQKTRMLIPTAGERLTNRPAVVLLLFFLVMLLAQLERSLFSDAASQLIPENHDRNVQILLALCATTVTVGMVLFYCLLVEKRSLASLGFIRRGAAVEYAIGLFGGITLFGICVLICVALGTLTLSPTESNPSWGLILLFFLGFLIQGMSEELLCRSYLMVSLSRSWPLWACAVTNALLFSLLHIRNPGVTLIALVNIFLFGLFASMLTLRRGSIWMVGALHSMWNFAQGNLFGIPVSGLGGIASPLHAETGEGMWQTLVNGGSFGLEGGLAVTVVLTVACCIVLFLPTKKSEIIPFPQNDKRGDLP